MTTVDAMNRHLAEARYWEAEDRLTVLAVGLARAAYPVERARLLTGMYAASDVQARTHFTAFGPDPIPGERRDLAESLACTALLYRLLADVEAAAAVAGKGRYVTSTWLEVYAGDVLDRMAASAELADRTALLEELYEAVKPAVGGQAAEALWCLPSPGHDGWLTLAEKDFWLAERGCGRRPVTIGRLLDRWLPFIGFVGVLVCVLAGVVTLLISWSPIQPLGLVSGLTLVGLPPVVWVRRERRRWAVLRDGA